MNKRKPRKRSAGRRILQRLGKRLVSSAPRRSNPLDFILTVMGTVYGGAVRLRRDLYRSGVLRRRRLPGKTIAIGNITAGGTGKTPLTMFVADLLQQNGYRVCILSRGYRGRYESRGGIVSDGRRIVMSPGDAGDEPYLLASRLPGVPVVVGKDRYAAGCMAHGAFDPDVFVLDDGFQHLRLYRDLDLVLLDGAMPLRREKFLPAGMLREPLSALADADAVIFRAAPTMPHDGREISDELHDLRQRGRGPIYHGRVTPYLYLIPAGRIGKISENVSFELPPSLAGGAVFSFSGIAQNWKFRYTLSGLGLTICGSMDFPDHHRYDRHDMDEILHQAALANAGLLATTEKDYIRFFLDAALPVDLLVVGIRFDFGAAKSAFSDLIFRTLESKKVGTDPFCKAVQEFTE